jgi:hypothetical protein
MNETEETSKKKVSERRELLWRRPNFCHHCHTIRQWDELVKKQKRRRKKKKR